MRICVPGHLYFGVPQAAGNLLNVDSFIGKKRYMSVPKVVINFAHLTAKVIIAIKLFKEKSMQIYLENLEPKSTVV